MWKLEEILGFHPDAVNFHCYTKFEVLTLGVGGYFGFKCVREVELVTYEGYRWLGFRVQMD